LAEGDRAASGDSGCGPDAIAVGCSADKQELGWATVSFLKYCKNGWNDITLDFDRGTDDGCDLSAINWFRFYNKTSGDVLVQFKDIYVYAE